MSCAQHLVSGARSSWPAATQMDPFSGIYHQTSKPFGVSGNQSKMADKLYAGDSGGDSERDAKISVVDDDWQGSQMRPTSPTSQHQDQLHHSQAQLISARTPKCARCRNHGLVSMLRVSFASGPHCLGLPPSPPRWQLVASHQRVTIN